MPLEDWYGVEVTDGRVTRLRIGGWDESVGRVVGNGLTGSLPPELGTLSALRRLEAAGNSGLTGPIPAQLGNLANLEFLSLQENWLTGSIPAALGRLANLERVWLHRNALVGSIPIPTELGNLSKLRILTFGENTLSGPVPPELGNLTSIRELDLGYTMLGGPLPVSMNCLSALEWLSPDGSGLCVPDSSAMRAWAAAIADFTGAFCEGSVSFSRVVTQFGLGRVDIVSAVADFNGDGRDDVVAGELLEYNVARPEERLTKAPLRVFAGERDSGFRHAAELVEGTIDVRRPVVVADDFNGDGRTDLAIFDAGAYVVAQSIGVGNPPQLFLSSPNGRLRPSDALADAVRREHALRPNSRYSGPADLHLKSATSGDIDGDGDVEALLRFDLLPQGFRNRDLRETVAPLCGLSPDDYGAGRMTSDLRRLRLRGTIERIARTQRYRLTAEGLCVALAYHRTQARVLGPVLSATLDGESTTRLREAVALYDREVDRAWNGRALAA